MISRLIRFLPIALLLTGCGYPPGRVVGRVTYKGAPLTSGSVMVHASDGNQYPGSLAADGTYHIDNIPVGPARITVHSHSQTPPGLLDKDRNKPAGREAAVFVVIPRRYAQANESGLTCSVKSGEQRCDLDLTQ
jgi:hypothetical protein